MLATFYLERDPLSLAKLPAEMRSWLQIVGGISALCLAVFCTARYIRERRLPGAKRNRLFVALAGLAFILYLAVGALYLARGVGIRVAHLLPSADPASPATLGGGLLALAGGAAIAAVLLPVLSSLFSCRWQRVWALARLSLKEALHSRVVLVFSAMALIFLFADWFVPYRDEDQVRNYVGVVYLSIAVIFVLTASLLGAFGIPTDIKNQSIHTIVTKPVEKFEIVLGRFLGYGTLLTVGLAAIAGLSLVYILRGVNERARDESFKARVPIYGDLSFLGTKTKEKGESVGRQWEYRSYISGPNPQAPDDAPKKYAVWAFDELPTELGERTAWIPFEYTFDIYRMNKTKPEEEGEAGIYCTFTFADGRIPPTQINLEKIRREREKLNAQARKGTRDAGALEKRYDQIERELAEKYGVYEKAGQGVIDYHTLRIEVPPELFKKLNQEETRDPRKASPGSARPPMLHVLVSIDRVSGAQLLGVARRDLYLLAGVRPFWANFLKGIVGMWFTFMLILGVAVACSAYMSGVISWLCAIFVFMPGLFVNYIKDLAENKTPGGGPLEAAYRIVKGAPEAAPLESSPAISLLKASDDVYRWWLRLFLNLIPDLSRYFDLRDYVAHGFDIAWFDILFVDNFLPLVGYLLPCAVIAYYFLKFREIANPT